MSEGITDYYADLALVRGGVVDSAQFLGLTGEKMAQIATQPPTALEDASLSTWIGPDGRHRSTSTIPRARWPASCWTC